MSDKIKKIRRTELIYEATTWGIIVAATLFVAFYFPYSQAFSGLLYVLIGATLTSTFWYLRSRRLYLSAVESAQEAVEKNRELIKQRQTSELIFEYASEGILLIDESKHIIGLSKGLERMIGFKKEELVGKIADRVLSFSGQGNMPSLFEIISLPKTEAKKRYHFSSYLDNSLKTKDGKFINVEITYDSFNDPVSRNVLTLAVLRDVTYEEEIRRRDREFVSMASHQIFTPLSMIRGFLSLLIDGTAGKLNDKQNIYSQKAYIATKRLGSLVASLLSTSKIDGERVKLEISRFDLTKAVEDLAKEYQSSNQLKDNKLTTEFKDRPLEIFADKEQLTEAINNILENAIHYTDNGRIILKVEKSHDQAIISVIDSGIGIPQNEIDRIGGKFFRAENAIKRDTHGTGLGLFVSYYLIKRHKGNIKIESQEHKGTTVIITLPLKQLKGD